MVNYADDDNFVRCAQPFPFITFNIMPFYYYLSCLTMCVDYLLIFRSLNQIICYIASHSLLFQDFLNSIITQEYKRQQT